MKTGSSRIAASAVGIDLILIKPDAPKLCTGNEENNVENGSA